jgi:hypothetical protein
MTSGVADPRTVAPAPGPIARLVAWFMALPFRKAIWLAPLAWTLHEAEEWNINEFESAHFVDPGYFARIDDPVLWLGLAQVALQGVLWTALTAWPKNPRFAAFLTLPFFVVLSFGNVLAHIYYVGYFRGYTPGFLTAVLLLGPVVLALTYRAVREKLIPWWYAAILYLAAMPGLVSTVQSGDQLPPFLQSLQQGAIHNAEVILGRTSPPSNPPR